MARIALVDDDRNILTSVSMLLEAEGFEVETYNDGQSALDAFNRRLPNRHCSLLAQALKQIHPIHAWHLDVQNSHVRKASVEGIQCGLTIIVGFHFKAFGLK